MIMKLDLSGRWGFCPDQEKQGIAGEYFLNAPVDTIELPGTTAMAGKGTPGTVRETDFMTDRYRYEGYAWYYRTVSISVPEGQMAELFLERTRLTKLWVNGAYVGECSSLCTPHVYDITKYIKGPETELCVMVSNTDYPTKGGHMTSPDTQSNWNGITGELSVRLRSAAGIKSMQAYPDAAARKIRLKTELIGMNEAEIEIWGAFSDGTAVNQVTRIVTAEEPFAELLLGPDAPLWDEHSPVTLTLKAAVKGTPDIYTVHTGLRDVSTEGLSLLVNGSPVFLRGKHDGMVFPETGAAPTTADEWYEVFRRAKEWGINHYRFHTCCPPEAAFTAADLIGMYLQPELPFWGTVHAPDDPDFNGPEQEYLIEEGRRILDTFGSHPSFVMMSLGNELWGSMERLDDILEEYHSRDSRHLYTQGSNNFQFYPDILEHDDFFSGVRLSKERLIRGSYAMCDAPQGFVQTDQPNTVHSYDSLIFPDSEGDGGDEGAEEIEIQYGTGVKKVRIGGKAGGLVPGKPIITHEVGQYCTYPDLEEYSKYHGVLRPEYLDIFRERLAEKGMLSYAEDLHYASGMLAFNCYKLEIEAAMRSEYISGFQLLDLQDFPGQCVALVGMLDPLMEEKAVVRKYGLRKKWLGACAETVILAGFSSFVVRTGDVLHVPVWIRNMSGTPLIGKKLCWSTDEIQESIDIPDGLTGLVKLGEIELPIEYSGHFDIDFFIIDRDGSLTDRPLAWNIYDLWAYREPEEYIIPEGKYGEVLMTKDLTKAKEHLACGGKVLYMPEKLRESIKGTYCTDFWCYPMFRSISESMGREIPVGTLGLLIRNEHPALRHFESEFYSTPQWYDIVMHSDCAVLDFTPESYLPIVQTVDNFERNNKLGLLYEAACEGGALMVCTSRLWEIYRTGHVQAFLRSLLEYMNSDSFAPTSELTTQQLDIE